MNRRSRIAFSGFTGGKLRPYFLILTLVFVTGIFLYQHLPMNPVCLIYTEHQNVQRVAHAGGGIGGLTYTNSIEAMNLNYSKGFRYFEIDFSSTTDSNIVCVHDWARFRELGKKDDLDEPLSLAEFNGTNESAYQYKRCTLETLANWFKEHEDAFLVTDVKGDNLGVLSKIMDRIPNSQSVVIPQVYTPDEYDSVLTSGVEKVIWTLYKYKINEAQVLSNLARMNRVIAITMPAAWAESSFPRKILGKGFAVYVHTVNDAAEYERLAQQFCVSEIYTDFLTPE